MGGVPGGWHPAGTGSGDLPADQFGVCGGQCFLTSVVLLACWALFITMLFPLVARCDNTIGALFKMGIAMALRNVMPVLAALMVTVAIFCRWAFLYSRPVLLVAPGAGELLQRLFCSTAFLINMA